jgi:hypothetical protein
MGSGVTLAVVRTSVGVIDIEELKPRGLKMFHHHLRKAL